MDIHRWDFATSLGHDRLHALTAPTSFEVIVQQIMQRMEILCRRTDPCRDLHGFKRVLYCIKAPAASCDLFFNASSGYRAAYYLSPYEGMSTSSRFIRSLLPAMLAFDSAANDSPGTPFIEESLSSPSSKVWLAEAQPGLCCRCIGEWSAP